MKKPITISLGVLLLLFATGINVVNGQERNQQPTPRSNEDTSNQLRQIDPQKDKQDHYEQQLMRVREGTNEVPSTIIGEAEMKEIKNTRKSSLPDFNSSQVQDRLLKITNYQTEKEQRRIEVESLQKNKIENTEATRSRNNTLSNIDRRKMAEEFHQKKTERKNQVKEFQKTKAKSSELLEISRDDYLKLSDERKLWIDSNPDKIKITN